MKLLIPRLYMDINIENRRRSARGRRVNRIRNALICTGHAEKKKERGRRVHPQPSYVGYGEHP